MARIIENERRIVKLSADDVICIVKEYQRLSSMSCCYEHLRELLENGCFYLPEDI